MSLIAAILFTKVRDNKPVDHNEYIPINNPQISVYNTI